MRNDFPQEIAEYFDLRWKKDDLHKIKEAVNIGDVKSFIWHLSCPFWATEPPKKIFDLKPIEIIEKCDKFNDRYKRIMDVDISYPVETIKINDRLVILDGIHRLAKHVILNKEKIKYRVIPGDKIVTTNKRMHTTKLQIISLVWELGA